MEMEGGAGRNATGNDRNGHPPVWHAAIRNSAKTAKRGRISAFLCLAEEIHVKII